MKKYLLPLLACLSISAAETNNFHGKIDWSVLTNNIGERVIYYDSQAWFTNANKPRLVFNFDDEEELEPFLSITNAVYIKFGDTMIVNLSSNDFNLIATKYPHYLVTNKIQFCGGKTK